MGVTGFLICVLVIIDVAVTAALGRFLTLLHRDDPEAFAEVATPEEIHLGRSGFYFLGPMKFLLFHIIPGAFESWSLTPESRGYAERLRWVSIMVVVANVTIAVYILFNVV